MPSFPRPYTGANIPSLIYRCHHSLAHIQVPSFPGPYTGAIISSPIYRCRISSPIYRQRNNPGKCPPPTLLGPQVHGKCKRAFHPGPGLPGGVGGVEATGAGSKATILTVLAGSWATLMSLLAAGLPYCHCWQQGYLTVFAGSRATLLSLLAAGLPYCLRWQQLQAGRERRSEGWGYTVPRGHSTETTTPRHDRHYFH